MNCFQVISQILLHGVEYNDKAIDGTRIKKDTGDLNLKAKTNEALLADTKADTPRFTLSLILQTLVITRARLRA